MRKNLATLRQRGLLMASMPGIIGVVVIGGRPVLYLAIGLISAALFLIGYVITAPVGKDQPFRRVYVLLYLRLNRASAPACPHLIHHQVFQIASAVRAGCDPGHHDGSMSGNGPAGPCGGDRGDGRAQREAPTLEELVRFAAQLPEDQAAALLRRARPASRSADPGKEIAGVPLRLLPRCPVCGKPFVRRTVRQKYCPDHKGGRAAPEPRQPVPEFMRRIATAAEVPAYASWTDFLDRTTPAARMAWCRAKAKKANRLRLMSGVPEAMITAEDVWRVLDAAQGRCAHCGSLAVEKRPSTAKGAPLPWEQAGRRIGSLGHRIARFNKGTNAPSNLCWSCLWCNTWPDERQRGAADHGGWHPGDD